MEILKKILTGMVILLVVIVIAGGFYLTSVGGMNHGTTDKNQKSNDPQIDNVQPQAINETGPTSGSQKEAAGQQPDNGGAGLAGAPVIIQVQPPKTDPGLYVEQMREKLKSINETNSSIASNSGGHGVPAEQNGQTVSTPQGDMNQLHQNFYKLGKDIATMEQSMDKLSVSIRDNQITGPQQFSYTYPYANYPYADYQSPAYPYYPNQSGQTAQPGQQGQQPDSSNTQQPDNSSTQQGGVLGNSGHSSVNDGQMNHSLSVGSFINSDSLKTVFTLMLLGSVVLAIVAVVGFLASLFKKGIDRPGINNQTTV